MKKYFPHHGSKGPWKLDQEEGSWRKVSYKFKTGKADKKIDVQFQLSNASGSIWIDQVSLKKTGTSGTAYKISLKCLPSSFCRLPPLPLQKI